MTDPPRKATFSVLPTLRVRSATWATRTLAQVAIFMPTNPAAPERTAPSKKATPACQAINSATNAATPSAIGATNLYSYRKNASAPSRMAAAISRMRGEPSLIFLVSA